mgnify:CR=1 FL=1
MKVIVGATEAKKRADIVVYTDAKKKVPRIFIEVKKPNRKDGIEQLKVYQNATGCRLGLWSNGTPPHVYLLRTEPTGDVEETSWRELRNIPSKNEKLLPIGNLKNICRKQGFYKRYELCKFLTKKTSVLIGNKN